MTIARAIHRRCGAEPFSRRGAAAVEAALVIPLLLTILLGCTDLARAISAQLVISNAARVAAEYGATHRFHPSAQADWEQRVAAAGRDEASTLPRFAEDMLSITVESQPEPGDQLCVLVTVEYPFETVVAWPGMPEQFMLRHQTGMRAYR